VQLLEHARHAVITVGRTSLMSRATVSSDSAKLTDIPFARYVNTTVRSKA
jgi:hypothetical protein